MMYVLEKKISIVTPVYNGEKYIEQCILSIKNQNYSNFQHIIVDGGSTDGTLNIIKKYDGTYPMKWISEKDRCMYHAIVKGFNMADGEIFAWLNSDDTFMPGAFKIMNCCISKGCKWVTGLPALQDENGVMFKVLNESNYRRKWIINGYYGTILNFIQQESTFWSADMWEGIDKEKFSSFKLAGDFWLWQQFAQNNELITVDTVISCFRTREGQLSSDIDAYLSETGYNFSTIKKFVIHLKTYIIDKLHDLFSTNKSRKKERIILYAYDL